MNIVVVKGIADWGQDASGEASPEVEAGVNARAVSEALANEGHAVAVCAADARLASVVDRLTRASDVRASMMVFNLVRGGSGDAPRAQIPGLLDLAGVPYTGPSPLGHAVGFDALLTRTLLARAGVAVPPSETLRGAGRGPSLSDFPLVVAPRYRRPGGRQRIVGSCRELNEAIEEILDADDQEAMIAAHFDGVELVCGLLGNGDNLELLPIVERRVEDPTDRGRVAGIDGTFIGLQLGAIAAAAFKATHCQDYARVMLRFDRWERPVVVDVDSMPRIDRDSSLAFAGNAGGYGHAWLVSRIVDTAHRRYFGTFAPRFDATPTRRRHATALRLLG